MLALAVLSVGLALIGIGVAVEDLLRTILILAGIAISVAAGVLWVVRKGAPATSGPSASDKAQAAQHNSAGGSITQVTSHDQRGGITAGEVELHQHAPQPTVYWKKISENQPWVEEHRGTKYLTKFRVRLEAEYAAGGLYVAVDGDCIGGFDVEPVAGGMTYIEGAEPTGSGGSCIVRAPLANAYAVLVYTTESDTVDMSAKLVR